MPRPKTAADIRKKNNPWPKHKEKLESGMKGFYEQIKAKPVKTPQSARDKAGGAARKKITQPKSGRVIR